jgi:DNA-3-methyladenine glycosylase
MYYCLNVVTEDEGVGAAVLIRALQPLAGLPKMRAIYPNQPDHKLCNGPGKVCKVFGIDKSFDGCDLISNTHGLFIEAGKDIPFDMIKATPRIGISGDDEARNVLWRWYVLPSALNDLHIKSFL